MPSDGQTYPLVTRSGAAIRCLPQLAATSSGQGEGFEVLTPDGTRYRFDQMATRYAATLTKSNPAAETFSATSAASGSQTRAKTATPVTPQAAMYYELHRQEVWLLPTQVTDRYDNTLTYTWSSSGPWQLASIASSNGRSLSFTYGASSHRIATISDGSCTWTYTYQGDALQQVTLPDASSWSFQLEPLRIMGPIADGGNSGPETRVRVHFHACSRRLGGRPILAGPARRSSCASIIARKRSGPRACWRWSRKRMSFSPRERWLRRRGREACRRVAGSAPKAR